jgi:hypothetical protein
VNELAQFLTYINKVFGFGQRLRTVRDGRQAPAIPTRPVLLSLILGVVTRVGSYLHLSVQTKRRRWQHLIGAKAISDDTFAYAAERLSVEDLRQFLVEINKQLKANKALESCKINGLLFLSLDANEHFKSRSRCCQRCCQRDVTVTDDNGQKHTVTEYYHRYVYAQINGPKINPLLDVEPILPGEAETQAALRLLGRVRRVYGVRFIDAITIDSWYVQGPFLKGVEKLGWSWVVVLKQERMEVFQEARRLSQGQECLVKFEDEQRARHVQLWEVTDLRFSEGYGEQPVRVIHSLEEWTERKVIGEKKLTQPRISHWWWMASHHLAAYPARVIYEAGHRRWGIENHAFNELTQRYHLEHCYHHHPVAMLAQLLILLLGFTLFNAYAVLHSQRVRLEKLTFKALAEALNLGLEADLPWDQWFACG